MESLWWRPLLLWTPGERLSGNLLLFYFAAGLYVTARKICYLWAGCVSPLGGNDSSVSVLAAEIFLLVGVIQQMAAKLRIKNTAASVKHLQHHSYKCALKFKIKEDSVFYFV